MLLLLFLLFTKHLVVDFFLQTNWMAFNKGNWKHPGGYCHAGFHGLVTAVILAFFWIPHWLIIGLLEAVAHFIIDWSKVNTCKEFNWHPKTHPFWWMLGIDQYLHTLCYLVIIQYTFYL